MKISKLFIHHPEQSQAAVKIFISKPSQEEEQELGRLFIILELKKITDHENLLEDLAQNAAKTYYQLVPLVKERGKIDAESILETVLQKMNQKISELKGKKIENKFNILIAILKQKTLYLAQIGKTYAFLIHSLEKGKYQMIDILENAHYIQNTEIFSNIIIGNINSEDFLLLSTESLFDYLSLEKIKNIISQNPIHKINEEFKKILNKTNKRASFASLIIKRDILPKTISEIREKIISPSLPPMEKLKNIEEETEKILSPSLRINFKKYLNSLFKSFKEGSKINWGKSKKIISFFNRFILFPPSFLLKNIALLFHKITKNIYYLIIQKKSFKNIIQDLAGNIYYQVGKIAYRFKQLPNLSKILLLTSLTLGLLFTISLGLLTTKRKQDISTEAYNQKVREIQNRRDLAEASIIYADEEKARFLLLEINQLLKKLPQDSKKRKKTYQNLTEETNLLFNKIKHLIEIKEPVELVDFAKTAQSEKLETIGIVKIKNDIYLYTSLNNILYKFNLDNKQVSQIQLNNSNAGNIQSAEQRYENTILFFHDKKGLAELNLSAPEKNLSPVELNLAPASQIADLALYNQNLYLLDTGKNQITKHWKTLSGFTYGINWLNEKMDIKDGVSLTIDGNIYLLKNNGEIIKLLSGRKEDFKIKYIEPKLENPVKIYTETTSDYLYVLEPKNKRLIILDKKGNLKAQYYSDKFDHLEDFIIDEQGKKIFLLNGSKLYGLVASHLK